jgi:hypothetical protein
MKNVFFTLIFLCSFNAHASNLESCLFVANIKDFTQVLKLNTHIREEKPLNIIVEIISAKDQGSIEPTACQDKIGTHLVIELTNAMYEKIANRNELALKYFYSKIRTRGGIVGNISIQVLD